MSDLTKKDQYIIAASSLVEPPVFYVGKSETDESLRNYKEKVLRVALTLSSAAKEWENK